MQVGEGAIVIKLDGQGKVRELGEQGLELGWGFDLDGSRGETQTGVLGGEKLNSYQP